MATRVDQTETSFERIPAATADAAGRPGWPVSRMRTDFWSPECLVGWGAGCVRCPERDGTHRKEDQGEGQGARDHRRAIIPGVPDEA